MRRTTATPPTMRELLEDPVFSAYMTTPPVSRNPGLARDEPWFLWVAQTRGTWLGKSFDDYPFSRTAGLMADTRVRDLSITSKRVFFGPPGEWRRFKQRCPVTDKTPRGFRVVTRWIPTFAWAPGLEWCARCRRPSAFRPLGADHHALRRIIAIVGTHSEDDNSRCVFCGIRRSALPRDPYSLED